MRIFHTLRLARSFLKAAGWRKLITLLALTAVFAVTFVGYVAADATERNALNWYLATAFSDYQLTPAFDFNAPPPPIYRSSDLANLSREATNISAALEKIPYVTSAGPFLESDFVSFGRPGTSSAGALNFVTAAMFKAQQAKYVDRIVSGTGDIGPRGVLVPMELALSYALAVGQTLPLYSNSFYGPANCTSSCTLQPGYVNVTVEGIYRAKAGPAPFDNNVFQWTFSNYVVPVILNLSDLPALAPAIIPSDSYHWQQIRYDAFVARAEVLDPLDAAGSASRLGALRTQMFLMGQNYKLQVYSSLDAAYGHFLADRSYFHLTVLFAVSPIILAAVVFGIMMENAEASTRYRDLFIARSRGAELRRLRRVLWLEAVLEAGIGCLIGLVGGVVAAFVSVPDAVAVLTDVFAVAISVSFALTLGIALSMKALVVRGLSKHTIMASVAQRAEVTTGKEVTGRVAILSIGMGVALLGASWFSSAPLLNVLQASSILFGTQEDWLLTLSFLSFLFAVSLYTPKITNRIVRRSRALADAATPQKLYGWTLLRSHRSPDPVVVLVASLVLSGSVFTTGLVNLQRSSVESAIYNETGSDILVSLPGNVFGGPSGQNNPPLAAYSTVAGIADLTFASGTPSPGGISVILVNSSTYLGTVRTDKLAFGGTLGAALTGFSDPAAAVVNEAFVEATGNRVGAKFGNLTITGVVPRMPGLQRLFQIDPPTIFTDYRNYGLNPNQTDITRVLVRVIPGADPAAVTAALASLDQLALTRNAQAEINQVAASPVFSALGNLWGVGLGAFTFLLFVALAGYIMRIRIDMENDFARMRARGLRAGLIRRILLPPVLLPVFASVAWGVGLGELSLFLMTKMSRPADAPFVGILPPLPLVLLVVVYIISGLGFTIGLARSFERLPLGPRLRERIA